MIILDNFKRLFFCFHTFGARGSIDALHYIQKTSPDPGRFSVVFVVCHVTIVAIGQGLLKKFWPLVIGCVLRTIGSSIIEDV